MKKRTKEKAIEKDPVVNDLKVPNEVQRENRKVHGNGSIRPLFVHSKFSTSAALAKNCLAEGVSLTSDGAGGGRGVATLIAGLARPNPWQQYGCEFTKGSRKH